MIGRVGKRIDDALHGFANFHAAMRRISKVTLLDCHQRTRMPVGDLGWMFVMWDRLPACHLGTDRLEAYPTHFVAAPQLFHFSYDVLPPFEHNFPTGSKRKNAMNDLVRIFFIFLTLVVISTSRLHAQNSAEKDNFSRENLVAWCIVPFDGKKRGPAERAKMVADLGLRRVAYDWRDEHVPTFEQEILEYKRRGLEYFAFWSLHEQAFQLFKKHHLHPQIWQIIPNPNGATQEQKVQQAAEQMLPLVQRTRKLGSKLGLYNHGGWSGQPANMVAVCQYLRQKHDAAHVGIVYNQHHAHDHIDDFANVIRLMKPYLFCLNLNGMNRDGDAKGQKILPIGAGDSDLSLLKAIRQSGYEGPIGIIGHTQDDVELRLRDNLEGLDWLLPQADGQPAGDKPVYRTWKGERVGSETTGEFSPQRVNEWIANAKASGDPRRGLVVFSSAKSACLSCHKLGDHGGTVGPDLVKLATTRKATELVASVLWPARHIEPSYVAHQVVTDDGMTYRGYVVRRDDRHLVLRDPARMKDAEQMIELDSIEIEKATGTLMPDNLLATMSEQQASDLFRFLIELGTDDAIEVDEMNSLLAHANIHAHGPATFKSERKPLDPSAWPSWEAPVNRGRTYDFYSKQADHFRLLDHSPSLLAEYPGLDGGRQGHWGNQNEETWSSNSWNEIKLGSVQSGIFRGGDVTVPRGVCVRLGDDGDMSVCFNPDTLTYDAIWTDGFLKFSTVRHGFMDGVIMDGRAIDLPAQEKRSEKTKYNGFYRVGKRVVFSYRIGDKEFLDSPWIEEGKFTRLVTPADEHPLRPKLHQAAPQPRNGRRYSRRRSNMAATPPMQSIPSGCREKILGMPPFSSVDMTSTKMVRQSSARCAAMFGGSLIMSTRRGKPSGAESHRGCINHKASLLTTTESLSSVATKSRDFTIPTVTENQTSTRVFATLTQRRSPATISFAVCSAMSRATFTSPRVPKVCCESRPTENELMLWRPDSETQTA